MARKIRVLYATSEAFPFTGTGGLAEVSRALPLALKEFGVEVDLILPFYEEVSKKGIPLRRLLDLRLDYGPFKEAEVLVFEEGPLRTFFIHRAEYYFRPFLYGPPGDAYPDNAQRFSFFCQAVLALGRTLGWPWDVLHCHDWHTALIPVLLPLGERPPVLFTIHNHGYQGAFPLKVLEEMQLPPRAIDTLVHGEGVNFLKGAILCSEKLSTVSPSYALEIQTPEMGFGLDQYLRQRSKDLIGILNGVDYSLWDPRNDPYLPVRFSPKELSRKSLLKRELMSELGFQPELFNRPLLGMVSRLVYEKGIELLLAILEVLSKLQLPLVVLGVGERRFEEALARASESLGNIRAVLAFDETMAHKVIAGSDIYLMPSLYEPCGLNQMVALRYGTIPVVRNTGGLKDTVKGVDLKTFKGTGFKFSVPKPCYFLKALLRAVRVYGQKRIWRRLQLEAMKEDFSWRRQASHYLRLYEELCALNPR